jgi:hypothetical protein
MGRAQAVPIKQAAAVKMMGFRFALPVLQRQTLVFDPVAVQIISVGI